MQIQDITLKNIASFLTGNWRYLEFQLNALEPHLKEQFYFRIVSCKDSCMVLKECAHCKCEVPSRMLVDKDNQACPFPNLMNEKNWLDYKNALNLDIDRLTLEAENILKNLKNK